MQKIAIVITLLISVLWCSFTFGADFTSRAVGNDLVLGWTHDGINTTHYLIEMGTATGGPYPTQITVSDKTARTWTIVNFWTTYTGSKYCFRCYAVNNTLKSDPSNEACATRPTTTTTSVLPTTTTTSVKPTTTTTSIVTTTTTSLPKPVPVTDLTAVTK